MNELKGNEWNDEWIISLFFLFCKIFLSIVLSSKSEFTGLCDNRDKPFFKTQHKVSNSIKIWRARSQNYTKFWISLCHSCETRDFMFLKIDLCHLSHKPYSYYAIVKIGTMKATC